MLPFDYRDFAIVSFIEDVVYRAFQKMTSEKVTYWPSDEEWITIILREIRRPDLELAIVYAPKEDEVSHVIGFLRKLRRPYAVYTPEEQLIKTILENPDYFPESVNDFKAESGEYGTDYHALYRFWRDYSLHLHTQYAIESLGKIYGGHPVAKGMYEGEDPTLWDSRKAFPDNDPWISSILNIHCSAKSALAFSPAIGFSSLLHDVKEDVVYRVVSEGDLLPKCKSHPHDGSVLFTRAGIIWLDDISNKEKRNG